MQAYSKYDSYKSTNIGWVNEMPSEWEILRFKFLANVKKGQLPKKITLNDSLNLPVYLTMEYLRGGNAEQFVVDEKALKVDEDEILLLWDGSNAGEFIKSRSGVVSSTVAVVMFSNMIDKSYAWYYLKFLELILREHTIGMGIPHVSGKALYDSKICMPTIIEQIEISCFLDQKTKEIDQAIAKKQRLITLLKEQKSILINQAVTKGLNPNVPMKDSGVEWIGEIPKHWKIKANRSLFAESKASGNKELPILSVSLHTGVSDKEQDATENVRAKVRIEDKSAYKLVHPGDVAFNMMRAWQGAIGVVKILGMVSPAYIVARPQESFNGEYFEYLYRTQGFISEMDRYSKGIADFRKRLYWDEFKQLKSVVPPLKEQAEIVEHIRSVTESFNTFIELSEREIALLNEYKQTLIAHAVTGKIKI